MSGCLRALLLGLLAVLGCSARVSPPAPPPLPSCPSAPPWTGGRLPSELAGPPLLDVRLGSTDRGLNVEIHASGASFERWVVGEEVPPSPSVARLDGMTKTEIVRAREGPLLRTDLVASADVSYLIPPRAASGDPTATRIEAQQLRGTLGRLLVVPEPFLSADLVRLRVRLEKGPAFVVSSAGTITRPREVLYANELSEVALVRGSDLAHVLFLGGPGGIADLDAPEGHDTCAWVGYTAFDPRAICAEAAGFRTLLHEYFHGKEVTHASLLFAVDVLPRDRFRVTRVTDGVAVAVSGRDPYEAPLRLAVAHELVHAWIGRRLWVGDPTPGKEAESAWFQEGVARWVAREQLVRAGLLSPVDLATEVNRLLAIVATSPLAGKPASELAAAATRRERGALPLLVARGALFATILDARIREATGGERSFDDVVRTLGERAQDKPIRVSPDQVMALADEALGKAGARTTFERVVVRGEERRLPERALGACFTATDTTYDVLDPGFDVEATGATAATEGKAIVGFDPHGPAAAAGLRANDVLVDIEGSFDRADKDVVLRVTRDGATKEVRYRPRRGSARGQGFRMRPGISEEACRKLLVRT